MYVTTRYIGIERGGVDYLFFLLTEDYIESNVKIKETLSPLLTNFARDLGDKGALVRPFTGSEKETLGDAIKKGWTDDQVMEMRYSLPAILVTDVDFNNFDAKSNSYLYISLKDSMNEFGDVKIFELQELLNELLFGAKINGLFQVGTNYLKNKKQDEIKEIIWDTIELKPGVLGFKFDLKKAIDFFRNIRKSENF